jgi:cysteinyl-tRNA synthetase
MPDYGALSGRKLDEQLPGARVAVDAHKKNPADFVLWKQSSNDEPGWESPWGRGRPGWHIECSAMSAAYLGDVFDIHGGGLDLIFPHHENEIAQSRCAHGTSVMANYWMHNGFLEVEGDKMSKSLGNFVTIHELLSGWQGYGWPGEALRFNMLRTHYRQPIDWTLEGLDESHKTLWTWYEGLASVQPLSDVSADVIAALSDDLNTPQMISALHGLHRSGKKRELLTALGFLGFSGDRSKIGRVAAAAGTASGVARARGAGAAIVAADIEKLIADRKEARARKDFKESDRIRDELAAMGVVIKDSKEGTTWEIAR